MNSDLLISTGGAIVGTGVGAILTATIVAKRGERERTKELFAQAQRGISRLQTQTASFNERRTSRRAQLTALAHATVGIIAGWQEEGKWLTAGARELKYMRDWDLQEGDRYIAGLVPALAEFSTAVVLLSLVDPMVRVAALQLADNLTPLATSAKSAAAIEEANVAIARDLAELSKAIKLYLKKRWWRIGPIAPRS